MPDYGLDKANVDFASSALSSPTTELVLLVSITAGVSSLFDIMTAAAEAGRDEVERRLREAEATDA